MSLTNIWWKKQKKLDVIQKLSSYKLAKYNSKRFCPNSSFYFPKQQPATKYTTAFFVLFCENVVPNEEKAKQCVIWHRLYTKVKNGISSALLIFAQSACAYDTNEKDANLQLSLDH